MTRPQLTPPAGVLVAIDVAKVRNEVLIEVPGSSRRRRLSVLNTRAEHDRLIALLSNLGQPVTCGFEATGNYHRPIAWRLLQAGFAVRLISSVALARTREALHNGWDKNDPKDAQVMLHMIRIGALQVYHDPLAAGINDVQELSKTHDAVSWAKTEVLHRILTHYLPLYFPEVDRFRHNSRSDWFFAFLDRFPTPACITALSKDAFIAAAWDVVGRKVAKAQLLGDIYETARSSIGLPVPPDAPAVSMFRLVIGEARGLIQQRDAIEATADALLTDSSDYKLLRRIPGIGPINALTILAEAGDLRRFGHHRQFLKFCGLDLATQQSGTFRFQTKLSKYGNVSAGVEYWFFVTLCGGESQNGSLRAGRGFGGVGGSLDPPMPKRLLPFIPASLRVIAVSSEPERVTVLAVPRSTAPSCPACRRRSDRAHGHYERRLADLPWQGRSVCLRVRLRRLRCGNPACPRRTFSESLPDVAVPHARRSQRLQQVQRHLGLALGGAPAARLAHRLALPASASTFLRMVRAGPIPVAPSPRVIAIDEWAWRRGRRYGTIIVDLERRAIVDLLPDRDTEATAEWLRHHPGVAIIARDRAEVYGEGVRQGAPEAVHVLDRWHLLRNLGESLQEVVNGHHAVIRSVARTLGDERAAALRSLSNSTRPATAAERRKLERHASRHARHAELLRLHAAGASVTGLARHLGLDRKTVRRWLRRDEPPRWAKPPRPSVLDPYRAYLDRRWAEGCRNGAALARELDGLGARIKPRLVRTRAMRRRRAGSDTLDSGIADAPPPWKPPTPRRLARLLQSDVGTIGGEDGVFIERLRHQSSSLAGAADLAVRLAAMLRGQSSEAVADWLIAARSSALKRFADGLQRDVEGIENAVALPWSTGPAEGQISRLKMIKRQMYGRAGFELLRQRVLSAA